VPGDYYSCLSGLNTAVISTQLGEILGTNLTGLSLAIAVVASLYSKGWARTKFGIQAQLNDKCRAYRTTSP
jgi:hypothetical protein